MTTSATRSFLCSRDRILSRFLGGHAWVPKGCFEDNTHNRRTIPHQFKVLKSGLCFFNSSDGIVCLRQTFQEIVMVAGAWRMSNPSNSVTTADIIIIVPYRLPGSSISKHIVPEQAVLRSNVILYEPDFLLDSTNSPSAAFGQSSSEKIKIPSHAASPSTKNQNAGVEAYAVIRERRGGDDTRSAMQRCEPYACTYKPIYHTHSV